MKTVKTMGLIVAVLGLLTAVVALITEGIKLYRELPTATPNPTSTTSTTASANTEIASAPESIIQENVENWVMGDTIYEEDFEDEVINGIKTKWGMFDIVQTSDGNHVWHTNTSSYSQLVLPNTSNDYAVEAKIMQVSGQKGFGFIQIRIEPREPCDTGYGVYLDGFGDWLNLVEYGQNCEELREDGLFANSKTSLSNEMWYTVRIETKRTEVRVYLNNELVARDKDIDGDVRESNIIGFSTCCGDLEPFAFDFDDIKVWLLNP